MSAHKFCTHPATKAERAKCRRQTEKGLSGVRVETVPAENEYARMCREIEEARNAKKGQTVTRETWREFRDLDVEIEYEVWGSQPNHQLVGRLVAWGASRLSYVSKAGKRNTIDVTRVLSVRAVLDQD